MKRLNLDPLLLTLVREIKEVLPEMAHLDPDGLLFVAGAARLAARASIRGFGGSDRPQVTRDGRTMQYEICLRPRFFLDAKPEERTGIIIHELWHVSERFDGTLAESRRHGVMSEHAIDAAVQPLIARFLASPSAEAARFLEMGAEARMLAWKVRPPSWIPKERTIRTRYDERDLFLAVVGGTGTRDG